MPLRNFFWHWRHSPLRRRSDVAESWLLLATGVLIAVTAPIAGMTTADAVADATAGQSRDRHSVSAVLTENPPARIGVDTTGGVGGRVHATVRWTQPDGTQRTGETAVAPGLGAGDRTTAWLDAKGALLRDPLTPTEAKFESIALGTVAGGGTVLLLVGAQRGSAYLLNRRRYAQWEREWAEAGTQWGHRQP